MGQSKSKVVDIKCSTTTDEIGLANELDKLKICTYNMHMSRYVRDDPNIDWVLNLISELQKYGERKQILDIYFSVCIIQSWTKTWWMFLKNKPIIWNFINANGFLKASETF